MNILKIYTSVLRKNKLLSVANLIGLSVGLSSCLFISMFVLDELAYDGFHKKIDRIFRITTKFTSEGGVDHAALSSSPLAETLQNGFPEVEHATRLITHGSESTVRVSNDVFREKNILKADSNVFRVFTFDMLSGDPFWALKSPRQVVLTASVAKKYFGSADPLNKTLSITQDDYLVSGVIKDLPENSSLNFSMLISMDSTDYSDDWFDFSYYTYVLLKGKVVASEDILPSFQKKLEIIANDKINSTLREYEQSIEVSLHTQPLRGMYFDAPLLYDSPKGNKVYTYVFSCVALLLLGIAGLNYVSFSMTQSIGRHKEIGIKKVMGIRQTQLIAEHVGESSIFILFSFLISLALTILMLPLFNEVTSRHYLFSDVFGASVLGTVLVMLVGLSLLAGGFPAIFMASLSPVSALQNQVGPHKGAGIRKFFMSFQFFIAIAILASTVVLYQQMAFVRNYELGLRTDNVMAISVPDDSLSQRRIRAFMENLTTYSRVKSVSLGGLGTVPGEEPERGSVTLKSNGLDEVRMVNYTFVDQHYVPSLEIELVDGRNFDGRESDFRNSVLVNESLVSMMGWQNPLEHQITWDDEERNIIGVVGDFHHSSLHQRVEPRILVYHNGNVSRLFVVLGNESLPSQVSEIGEAWRVVFPTEPLVYNFLDESIANQYHKEEQAMLVLTYFSLLTMGISCLGLIGLASLAVTKRKKEIGVRKIVGAGFASILVLLSREFFLLVSISGFLGSLVSWWLMQQWLETFPYRMTLGVSVFAWVGLAVIAISLLSILVSISRLTLARAVDLLFER